MFINNCQLTTIIAYLLQVNSQMSNLKKDLCKLQLSSVCLLFTVVNWYIICPSLIRGDLSTNQGRPTNLKLRIRTDISNTLQCHTSITVKTTSEQFSNSFSIMPNQTARPQYPKILNYVHIFQFPINTGTMFQQLTISREKLFLVRAILGVMPPGSTFASVDIDIA